MTVDNAAAKNGNAQMSKGEKAGPKTRDLTKGPIGKSLVLFALPLLAGSLIQQLYNTVDLIFVGQILGKEASAAVGASGLLITCMVGFFTGMSVGSGVVAARFFGAGDKRSLKKTIHTAMAISFGGGAALTLVGFLLAPRFLEWLQTPAAILAPATEYIRIYFFSLIPLITYNIGAGVLRALGNSRAPMLYQLVGGLGNVLANTLFIWALGWGVRGAAVATFLSQTVAALLVLRHLMRLDRGYRLSLRGIHIDGAVLKKVLAIGVPAGIQAMVITLSNLIVQYHINSLGVDNIAAFTAYFRVELFIYLPIMAFGQAATTFTGQNIGAGEICRVRQGVRAGLLIGAGVTLALSAALLLFAGPAFGLFSGDGAVIAIGRRLAFIAFPFYVFYVVLEVLASTIRGAGRALPPMVIVLVNLCLLRSVLLFLVMRFFPAAEGVAAVFPVTWGCASVCFILYYRLCFVRALRR